jgi:hypothetical protein
MSWLKGKAAAKPAPSAQVGPHVPRATQELIARFLVTYQRVELHNGRPQLHFLGMSHNHHDGSVDYAVRSRVLSSDGEMQRFDSQVRIYASGHLKLIR